jgi:hypothetical protein
MPPCYPKRKSAMQILKFFYKFMSNRIYNTKKSLFEIGLMSPDLIIQSGCKRIIPQMLNLLGLI